MLNYHVYCHIPFCKKRCQYCCFTAQYEKSELTNLSLMDDYVEAIRKDILGSEFPEGKAVSIVFGGGTPSLLSDSQLKGILDAIKQKIPKDYDEINYLGYEISPDTASFEKLESFRKNGFNRISVGVQSFIDSELKLLGRPYNRDTILKALDRIRSLNYDVVNVDLLIGIPGQTLESIMSNINDAVLLKSEHISINIFYSKYDGGKEFLTKCNDKTNENKIMTIEDKIHIYDEVCKVLIDKGYERIDNTVFSLPSGIFPYEKNVIGDTKSMLAFGPGSSGFLGKLVRYTPPSITEYIKNQKVEFKKVTMNMHAFAIAWIHLISHHMLSESVMIDFLGMGFEELRSKNKYIDHLFSVLISENLAFLENSTLKIDEKSLNKAIVLLQYIRGGNS